MRSDLGGPMGMLGDGSLRGQPELLAGARLVLDAVYVTGGASDAERDRRLPACRDEDALVMHRGAHDPA